MPADYNHTLATQILESIDGAALLGSEQHRHARQLLFRLAGTAYVQAAFAVDLRGDRLTLVTPSGGSRIVVNYQPNDSSFSIEREGGQPGWVMSVVFSDERQRLEDAHEDDPRENDALVALAKFVKRLCGPPEDFSMGKPAD
jgi:hypothetical protein